jgi:hypothetical protein
VFFGGRGVGEFAEPPCRLPECGVIIAIIRWSCMVGCILSAVAYRQQSVILLFPGSACLPLNSDGMACLLRQTHALGAANPSLCCATCAVRHAPFLSALHAAQICLHSILASSMFLVVGCHRSRVWPTPLSAAAELSVQNWPGANPPHM